MASYTRKKNWNELLQRMDRLQRSWDAKRIGFKGKGRRWLGGVRLGIESGTNALAEEIAKANPNIVGRLSEWVHDLSTRRKGSVPGQEGIEGVDYGISLVIDCVCEFLNIPAPPKAPHPEPRATRKGSSTEKAS